MDEDAVAHVLLVELLEGLLAVDPVEGIPPCGQQPAFGPHGQQPGVDVRPDAVAADRGVHEESPFLGRRAHVIDQTPERVERGVVARPDAQMVDGAAGQRLLARKQQRPRLLKDERVGVEPGEEVGATACGLFAAAAAYALIANGKSRAAASMAKGNNSTPRARNASRVSPDKALALRGVSAQIGFSASAPPKARMQRANKTASRSVAPG